MLLTTLANYVLMHNKRDNDNNSITTTLSPGEPTRNDLLSQENHRILHHLTICTRVLQFVQQSVVRYRTKRNLHTGCNEWAIIYSDYSKYFTEATIVAISKICT